MGVILPENGCLAATGGMGAGPEGASSKWWHLLSGDIREEGLKPNCHSESKYTVSVISNTKLV